MKFTYSKTIQATILSIGIAKVLDLSFHVFFNKRDNDYEHHKQTLIIQSLSIVIAFLILRLIHSL